MRFRLSAIFNTSWLIQLHLLAAVLALMIGATILSLPGKGARLHRMLGWSWVGVVSIAVLTSIFMRRDSQELPSMFGFSVIHIFTLLAGLGLPFGIWAARQKNVLLHRAIMIAVYAGTLTIAALFAMLPGRLLHDVLRGIPHKPAMTAASPTTSQN